MIESNPNQNQKRIIKPVVSVYLSFDSKIKLNDYKTNLLNTLMICDKII